MTSLDVVRERIDLPVADGSTLDAWAARPAASAPRAGVIVGMELFGVNDHVRDLTARVARLGYLAIAPNFYHRHLPNASLPYGAEGRAHGFEELARVGRAEAVADVRATYEHLVGAGAERVGFVGFSLGAHVAYLAAASAPIAACACFYPGWLTDTQIPLSRPEPTITLTPRIAAHGGRIAFFVGGRDHAVGPEARDAVARALHDARVRHEIVVYPDAPHGFFCEERDTFHAASRDDAWRRVEALFAEELPAPR